MNSKTILATLFASVALVSQAMAQTGSQPGYVTPDSPAQDSVYPAPTTEQQDANRTLEIRAARERQEQAAVFPGSSNRMDPQQTYPGELPEKVGSPWTIDLDGRVVRDASLPQISATSVGRVGEQGVSGSVAP